MQTYVLNKGHGLRGAVKANLHSFIDRLPDSKSWKIEIKEARKERSDLQNHALFGVAYPALEAATGMTKDELHDAFCRRYFGTVEKEFAGQVITRPYRTTTRGPDGERDLMLTRDFADFYAMVQMVGAEAGIDVPDPDPMWNLHQQAA